MKYIKLFIIAALLIGAVGLLLFFSQGGDSGSTAGVTSGCAKAFEKEITELCKDGQWTSQAYRNLQNKMNTFANDGNLQPGEKNSLSLFLYTESCKFLFRKADRLFAQSFYPSDQVASLKSDLSFMKELNAGSNSNLTQGLALLHEYETILACCSFSSAARYSVPLRPFPAGPADRVEKKIQGLKYYDSHFSKNEEIREQIAHLASNLAKAESEYYDNLEKCIESHCREQINQGVPLWQALEQVGKDYNRFEEISTNNSAIEKLNRFLQGNHHN